MIDNTKGATAGQAPTPAEIKTRVDACILEIQSATGRLEELQDSCKHSDTSVELINRSLKNTCNICGHVLGYASQAQKVKAGYIK